MSATPFVHLCRRRLASTYSHGRWSLPMPRPWPQRIRFRTHKKPAFLQPGSLPFADFVARGVCCSSAGKNHCKVLISLEFRRKNTLPDRQRNGNEMSHSVNDATLEKYDP